MKKIWKIRRDEEAVSPVIATILMVAITVVLAAVLYIMVTSMTGDGGPQTPMGSMNVEGTGGTTERVYFGNVNPDQKPTECKLILYNTTDNTKIGTYSFPTTDISGSMTGGQWSVTIAYVDLMDDKIISVGDYMDISGLVASKSYKVTLVWISSGGEICSTTFSK